MEKELGVCIGYGDKLGLCRNKRISPRSKYCKNCAGAEFEDEIANIFRAQGYTVTQNVVVESTQNDFIAELRYGIAKLTILVECKSKFNSEDKVNGEVVRKLQGSLQVCNRDRRYGNIDQAYIITNGKFAPQAHEIASSLNIHLYTELELINSFMNFEPYLKKIVSDYETSILYNHYIELYTDDGDSLETVIDEFIENDNENACAILGEYGSGKTSFCLTLAYKMAKSILNNRKGILPLYIKLRDYNKAIDLNQLITDILVNQLRIVNGSIHTFKEFIKYGHMILIFDGFDEISRKADRSIKNKVISEISKFSTSKTKIIVSCRPNYFETSDEQELIFKRGEIQDYFEPNSVSLDFHEVCIQELKFYQIANYIKSFNKQLLKQGTNSEKLLEIIKRTHDLEDLAKRPVLLNIIVETLPCFKGKNMGNINAAKLYQTYTDKWLYREDEKGKTLIDSSDKILFSEALSLDMFIKDDYKINYKMLPEAIKEHFNYIKDISEINYFSQDIQSCSFLTTDGSGDFYFIHKSFMEYFAACKIIKELDSFSRSQMPEKELVKNTTKIIGDAIITFEINLFIRDKMEDNRTIGTDIYSLYLYLKETEINERVLVNLLSILAKDNLDMSDEISLYSEFSYADLSYIRLRNKEYMNLNFSYCIFYSASFENIVFQSCQFTNSIIKRSAIENVNFGSLDFTASKFANTNFTNCNFKDASLIGCEIRECVFSNCNFSYSDLTNLDIDSKTKFIGCIGLQDTIGLPYELNY